MAELRWILLLAGLVFLAGLTLWEMRRPRQGRGDALSRPERTEPTLGGLNEFEPPTVSLAEPCDMHDMRPTRATRVPLEDPLQVELPPAEPSPVEPPFIEEALVEPPLVEPPLTEPAFEPPLVISFDGPVLPHAADEHDANLPLEQQPLSGEAAEQSDPIRDPIVDWPPEEQRHILAVRVVGLNPDRMSGRPLRQALSACGFVHGRFGIFHQPGADGRALISAANLNKPGVFDPASMDFQRFRGLGLFAVLPGPLPPAAALDHLLDTAGDLAQRLHARLQDENGMPLDEERLEGMARIVQGMTQGGLRAEPAA